MSKTEPFELYVNCSADRMDELIGLMRKLCKRPWMYWDTHYNASFSPPDPSFDFARFDIEDLKSFVKTPDASAKYLGQVRWIKQRDFDAVLAWETFTDGSAVGDDHNNFLLQDFFENVVTPTVEQLKLEAVIGPSVWKNRKK